MGYDRMAKRVRKSDVELYEASKHIDYETTQLNDCIFRLAWTDLREKDVLLYNAVLTAFTVHARNLYLFLYATSPRRDDVFAADYFNESRYWVSIRPTETTLLKETSERTNKLSAHLTYDRIQLTIDHWWKWIAIHHDLRTVLRVFVVNAPSHRINPKLQNFEQEWGWTDNLPPPP